MSEVDTVGSARDSSDSPRLSTAVYDGIVRMIERGDFALKARLPSEARLCAMFGASRPVVREALARLREDGVVVSRQGSGSYVRRQPDPAVLELTPIGSLADVQRCFEFRLGIEPVAAGLAALRWQADDVERIAAAAGALERCLEAGELGAEEDCLFHEAVADATQNNYYRLIQRQMRPQILAGMNVSRSLSLRRPDARLRRVLDEHAAIVEALRRRDPEASGELMRAHILDARNRMFEGVET